MRGTLRHRVLGSLLSLAGVLAAGPLVAAVPGYVAIKAKTQGQLKGESMKSDRAGKWMEVLAFKGGLTVPYDAAGGAPTGRKKHDPVCFTKRWGAATPQLLSAAGTSEVLTEVDFEFSKIDAAGKEVTYLTYKLTNATIVEDHLHAGGETEPVSHPTLDMYEEVCLAYQRIDVSNLEARTSYSDTW